MRTTISSNINEPNTRTLAVMPDKHRNGQRKGKSIEPSLPIQSPRHQLCQSANCGDHPLIFDFLRSAAQSPTEADFEHTQDRFNYHPHQRLLIRENGSIAAHVRMVEQELLFGSSVVPTVELTELATFPGEHESLYRRLLVSAARQRAIQRGICLLTTRALCDEIERRPGWIGFQYGSDVTLSVADLLARIEIDSNCNTIPGRKKSADRYAVQPWRYLEKDSIRALYDLAAIQIKGAVVRDDEYWHWLLQRRGFDRALVAVSPVANASKQSLVAPNVVAYGFARGSQVVELIAHPDHLDAIPILLRRFALDLLEMGNHSVTLTAGSTPQSHELISAAGYGNARVNLRPRILGACVVSAESFLKHVSEQLVRRHQEAGLKESFVLGFVSGSEDFTLEITRHRARFHPKVECPDRIVVSPSTFSRILLGVADIDSEIASGRVSFTTPAAEKHVRQLFPRERFWRLPLDDLPAIG